MKTDLVQDLIKESRKELLQYMLSKSTSSKQIEQFETRIEQFEYPKNEFLANTHLVGFYLEIEEYLLFKDPRYINTKEKLRKEVSKKYPKFLKSEPFLPLFEVEKKQTTLFSYLFLKYLINDLMLDSKSNEMAQNYISRSLLAKAPPSSLNIVERVNRFQNLKAIFKSLKEDMDKILNLRNSNRFIQENFFRFSNSYPNFKALNEIDELIPTDECKSAEPKIRKLIVVDDSSKTNQNLDPLTEKNKNIFQNILDGYVLIDTFGTILFSNYNAERILNTYPEKLEGASIFSYLPRDFSTKLNEDLLNVYSENPNHVIGKRTEIVLQNASLEDTDYEISISDNDSKNAPTYSIFFKDISDKKHMLEAIRESKIQAEHTAKVKTTFLSNMSHEIRTPLNVILGLTEILKKDSLDDLEMFQKNLDGIDFSAKNLLSIVNDILDFSKIEAGKLSLQSIDFNLRKVVESLTDGFEIKAREKGLELITEFEDDVPHIVIGDQYRLNQILNNLIGNAIKFTKKGFIKVKVELVKNNTKKIELCFKVEDTGIGISKENLEKIFDSFYQTRNGENMGGTGLGLAITKELVSLQNGILTAKSTEGIGSAFSCTIPYQKSRLKSRTNSSKTYSTQDKNLEGLKVLVAEDNQMNQFFIKQLLEKLKVEVDIANNGEEAIDILATKNRKYDLILMDMHMPVMNGFEAIKHIKTMHKFSTHKIPIVACSADVFPEARKNAIKAGIDFYLTKPLTEEAIKEVLFWLISDDNKTPIEAPKEPIIKNKADSNKTIQLSSLLETFDNDKDFIISLLEVFIKTTPEDYESLQKCFQREYYTRASLLAHKLKSNFMNLGMTTHGHHLQQIESNVASKDGLEKAKEHLKQFSVLYHKALFEVNMLLIELKKGK